VRGVVTSTDGRPLRRAQVELWRDPPWNGAANHVLTDDAGRYEITGIAPGRYTIQVARTGYVTTGYGRKTPSASRVTFELKGGQLLSGADVALLRGGVIAGTILDEAGEPMAGATVHVARVRYVEWQASAFSEEPVVTDDLGRFRAFDLQPGRFYMWATTTSSVLPARENRLGYLTTYYPGTLLASEARPLALDAGEQVQGITLAMHPGATATVSGVLRAPDNDSVVVSLAPYPRTRQLTSGTDMNQFVQPGPFAFQGVTPGEYRVTAMAMQTRNALAFADLVLNAGDSPRISLTVSTGTTLRGRVVFESEGAAAPTGGVAVKLTLVPLDRAPTFGEPPAVAADGSFVWEGVHARRILLRAALDGWMLKRVALNGLDVTDDPIEISGKTLDDVEIVLTRRLTEVAGTVTDPRGAGVAGAAVVLFADDPGRWGPGSRFTSKATTDAQGRFSIRGLPPARYVAVAVDSLEDGEDTNPEALDMWRVAGTRVTLGDGGTQVVQLRIF
jgi:protocatechuate 3,4-dioxygenase beta subunit